MLPHALINDVPLVYVHSIKYLRFTFSRNHKDDDDMLRQMTTSLDSSIKIIRIFHNYSATVIELGRSFGGSFYIMFHGLNTISPLFLKFVMRITTYIS